MILQPESRKNMDDVYSVAEKYLNQIIFIGWPHLVRAKVVGVSNKDKYIDMDGIKDLESKIFDFHVKTAQEQLSITQNTELIHINVINI